MTDTAAETTAATAPNPRHKWYIVHAYSNRVQKADGVTHIVAERFTDLSVQLAKLREEPGEVRPSQEVKGRLIRSRDFH